MQNKRAQKFFSLGQQQMQPSKKKEPHYLDNFSTKVWKINKNHYLDNPNVRNWELHYLDNRNVRIWKPYYLDNCNTAKSD